MNKSNKWMIPVSLVVGCLPWLILCGIVFVALVAAIAGAGSGTGTGGGNIALIHVSGVITGGSGGGGLFDSGTGAEKLIKQLEKARKDDKIKAVVLRINSPGGSAAGSQEVYDELVKVRRSKPVVASMGDVAASGGYYIAAASDKIYANGSTITGSIGVIMETSDMSKLFQKLGIEFEVVKSGKHKDMGASFRKLTPEERQIMQAMINDVFAQFVTAVSQGRKMPESEVRKIADGRVFTGRQAKKSVLVDQLGGLREAVAAAGKAARISGEPKVVDYDKSAISTFFGTETETRTTQLSPTEEAVLRRLLKAAPDLMQ